MPEYVETVASSTSSRRMVAAHVQVPRGNAAGRHIMFQEEEVVVIGSRTISNAAGSLGAGLAAGETFALLNPNTGAATGQTATHADLYRMLYSLYIDLSAKRDAAAAPPP